MEVSDSSEDKEAAVWQREECGAGAVMQAVLARLPPRDVWRAAAVCRAWRAAAAAAPPWRRALCPRVSRAARRLLAAAPARVRAEWTRSVALWRETARLTWDASTDTSDRPTTRLQRVSLSNSRRRLVLLDDRASYVIWEREGEKWIVKWQGNVCNRGWQKVDSALWAPHDDSRLLLAGPLLLTARWELLVVALRGDGALSEEARIDVTAGGAACWAGPDIVLAPRLHAVAPGLALTALWLTRATAATRCEHAGVTTPLLRVYNEASASLSHILLVDNASEHFNDNSTMNRASDDSPDEYYDEENDNDDIDSEDDDVIYLRSNISWIKRGKSNNETSSILVAAMGCIGGARGEASALATWSVQVGSVPPCRAAGSLRERVQARRAAAGQPAREPREDELRALCRPPRAALALGAAVLAVRARARTVWALTAEGALWCASLPALRPLRRLPPPTAPPRSLPAPHYAQLDIADGLVVGTSTWCCGEAWVWRAAGGEARALVARGGVCGVAALDADTLLLATPGALTVWCNEAYNQS